MARIAKVQRQKNRRETGKPLRDSLKRRQNGRHSPWKSLPDSLIGPNTDRKASQRLPERLSLTPADPAGPEETGKLFDFLRNRMDPVDSLNGPHGPRKETVETLRDSLEREEKKPGAWGACKNLRTLKTLKLPPATKMTGRPGHWSGTR